MKKHTLLPIPPIDQLPYENLREEWHTLTFDLYVIRMAQLYWASWVSTEKIWTTFRYNNNAWGLISSPYSWFILPDKTIEKRWTSELPEPIQNLADDATYNGYSLFLLPIGEEETDQRFEEPFDEGEFSIFPTSNLFFTIHAHEAFHKFQEKWLVDEESSGLDTPDILELIMKNPHARELRLELFKNLRNAILYPYDSDKYLSWAKYWLNTYYEEYKDEADLIKDTDIDEGSARYFEIAITCRSLFGFYTSTDELYNAYRRLVDSFYLVEKVEQYPELEVYNIGGLAGILLEMTNHAQWQDRVEAGERAEDILLEIISPHTPKTHSEY